MLQTHAAWRISKYGSETIARENAFQDSEMNREGGHMTDSNLILYPTTLNQHTLPTPTLPYPTLSPSIPSLI